MPDPRDGDNGDLPYHLRDEKGGKLQFQPCVVDKIAFKRRMLERKANGATDKT